MVDTGIPRRGARRRVVGLVLAGRRPGAGRSVVGRRPGAGRGVVGLVLAGLLVPAVAGCAARPGTPKTVTLELMGPGTATEVAYSYPAGPDVAHGLEHGSALPWSKTLTVGAGRTVAVGLTAPGGPSADGRYACKVTIDGRAEPVATSIYGAENRGERHNGLDLSRYLNLDLTGVDKMGQLDNSGQIVLCSVTVE